MEIFERMSVREHEQLVFWNEPRIGYKGIIAIHNTTLGPALGGTRFWNYADTMTCKPTWRSILQGPRSPYPSVKFPKSSKRVTGFTS